MRGPAVLLTLIVPVFISGAVGSYLFYAQHNFPGVTFNDAAGWTYEKAAMQSFPLSAFESLGRPIPTDDFSRGAS